MRGRLLLRQGLCGNLRSLRRGHRRRHLHNAFGERHTTRGPHGLRGHRCDVCRQVRRKQRGLRLPAVQYVLRNGFLHGSYLSAGWILQRRRLLDTSEAELPNQPNLLGKCLRLSIAVSDVQLRMRQYQHRRGQLRHLPQELRSG